MGTPTALDTRTEVIPRPRTTTTTLGTRARATRPGTTATPTVGVVGVDTPWREVHATVEEPIMDLTGVGAVVVVDTMESNSTHHFIIGLLIYSELVKILKI